MADMLTGLELLAQRVRAGIIEAGHVGQVLLRLHSLNPKTKYLVIGSVAALRAIDACSAVSCRYQVARTHPDLLNGIAPHPLTDCGDSEFLAQGGASGIGPMRMRRHRCLSHVEEAMVARTSIGIWRLR